MDLPFVATLITILTAGVGCMGFLWKLVSRVDVIAERMTHADENFAKMTAHLGNFEVSVENQLQKVADVLTSVARQDERLNSMTITMTALQAGQLSLSERVSYLAGSPAKKRNA